MVFRGGLETERGDEGNISKLVEWSVCTRNAGSNLNKRTTTSHLSAVCDAVGEGGEGGPSRARNTGHGHFFSTFSPLSFPLRFVVSYRPVSIRNELRDVKGFFPPRLNQDFWNFSLQISFQIFNATLISVYHGS